LGSILTTSSSKGGAGKSTLCIVLAVNLATRHKIAVVDADRNQSFAAWYGHAYEGPTMEVRSEVDHIRVVDLAGELAETHDVVIVDTAGFENLTAASAIGMADHVAIPCMPDRGSVRETLRTAQQVASLAKAARRTIPYSIILTRWKPRGLAERATIESLQEAGHPMLTQYLTDSADHAKLSFTGFVPISGRVGNEAGRIIDELQAKGAIPTRPSSDKEGKAGKVV
jgi:chromosome partitioning protein